MTLTVEFPADADARLQQEAKRQGLDATDYVRQVVLERLQNEASLSEGDLLARASEGPPQNVWSRYHALIAKRRTETLTSDEYEELLRLSDVIETAHARRMTALVDLAERRGVPLDQICQELGLPSPGYV